MAKIYYESNNIMEEEGFFCRCNQRINKQGQRSTTNWHDHIEILCCIEGNGEILLDNKSYSFKNGNIVIANSGVIHSLITHSRTSYICVHIDREFLMFNGVDTSLVLFKDYIENDAAVYSAIFELNSAVIEDAPFKTALVNSCLLKLLLLLCKTSTPIPQSKSDNGTQFHRIKELLYFIRQNYDQPLSLEGMSRLVGINKYQLTREFKAATGRGLNEHINAVRCNQARKMIESGLSVSEAAFSCGYRNLSYFSKTYKKHLGELPSRSKNTFEQA